MGIFSKSRKTVILNATKGLSNLFFSKTMDLSNNKKITQYEQNVLLWLFLGAKGLIDSILTQEGYPLYKASDNQLGVEGNALNAYYKMTIFLLYIHEQRVKNKKEIHEIADTPISSIAKTLNELLSLEEDYVKDYINHLKELQTKFDENTLEVMQYQMVDSTKDLMSDGRNVKELFDDPKAQLFLPMAFNIQLIEQTKALDKLLGLSAE
jgi:hypothetical protein